jgi:hypothetical protein
MTSRQWITAGIIAVLLMIGSIPFSDPSTAAFWLGIGVLIYLVLLKIELKAARLYLCFAGLVGGVILAFVCAAFLLESFVTDHKGTIVFLMLMSPILSLAGGSLGFWLTARIVQLTAMPILKTEEKVFRYAVWGVTAILVLLGALFLWVLIATMFGAISGQL